MAVRLVGFNSVGARINIIYVIRVTVEYLASYVPYNNYMSNVLNDLLRRGIL